MAKYVKAVYHTRVSVGMRFRMLFETEESSVRRYNLSISLLIFYPILKNKNTTGEIYACLSYFMACLSYLFSLFLLDTWAQ